MKSKLYICAVSLPIDLKSSHSVGVFPVLALGEGTMLQLSVKAADISTQNSNGDSRLRTMKAN